MLRVNLIGLLLLIICWSCCILRNRILPMTRLIQVNCQTSHLTWQSSSGAIVHTLIQSRMLILHTILMQYSLFYRTTCQPCVSAYFDTFMQLHMMTIKNHPSSRLNSILGTNGVLDARIYRRLSIKWPYMHHHVQLWSLTDYHSIIGTTCATLSAMHSHLHILPHIVSISIPERMMLWRSALFPFRFHAVIAPSSIVHRCKITWRYWHKFWNRINDS